MTQGPEYPPQPDPEQQPGSEQWPPPPPPESGPAAPGQPPYGQPQYGQAPYGQPGHGQAPYGQAPYGQPQYAPPGAVYGVTPQTPYGVHPVTGIPYSDKSKIVAGLLQILLPLGIGRFYIGDTTIGVIQLVVTVITCGIGALWPVIDGIIMLATDSKDVNGYMLRS